MFPSKADDNAKNLDGGDSPPCWTKTLRSASNVDFGSKAGLKSKMNMALRP